MSGKLDAAALGSMAPIFVARALLEAGGEVIRRAWAYLAAWAALERAGVPALLRRELLDPRLVSTETQALQVVRAWASKRPRSTFAVLGDVGLGKSYAGAWWLLEQHRRGRGIRWVSLSLWSTLPFDRDKRREEERHANTLNDEMRRAIEADAIVLDDLGVGGLTPTVLQRLNTLLVERDAAGRPTLLLLNSDGAEAIKQLDTRVADRMRAGGGGTVKLRKAASMRGAREESDDTIDDHGRGRSWHAAADLIEHVGARDLRHDGTAWSRDQRAPILEPEFGWRLERIIAGAGWIDRAEQARVALRVDAAEIARIADALVQQDLAFANLGLLPRAVEAMKAERVEHRAGEIRSTAQILGRQQQPRVDDAPSLPEGERQRLAAAGVRVRYSDALGQWEARRLAGKRRKVDALSDDGETEFARALNRKHGRLLGSSMTERGAWWIASQAMQLEAAEQSA